MGVKKTMDTFFASMQEQSMSGYGGRLVNTPMGPFRWNDVMELWENVNNGMVMNNISFQDSIMMLDYSSTDGGFDIRNIPVVPGGDPNLVLFINFNNETLGSVTFSRSTVGRVLRSNRFLGLTAANNPRFNYYPEGITAGLLIEDTSKNLLSTSSIVGGSWAPNSYLDEDENPVALSEVTAVTGITSPLGTTTSIRISAVGNTTSQHYYYTLDSFSAISGQTFTASLWTKGTPGTTFNRYLGLVCDGNQARAMFDLQNNTYQGYAGSNEFGKITTYINDWKRIEMTWVAPTTGAFTMWVVPHVSFVDPIDTYYADDGNTSGFFITNTQLEVNSSASSFIVSTTNGGTTRGNDLAYFAGTGFTWFNGSCGTFVFEFDKKTAGHTADNIKTRTVMGMNYDSSNNYGLALEYTIGSTVASIRAANGNMLLNNSGLTNGMNKVAFSYNNTGTQMAVESSVNGSATQSTSPDLGDFNISGATFMTLGYKQALVGTTAYDYLDTIVRSVQYWNIGITGSKLQQLST